MKQIALKKAPRSAEKGAKASKRHNAHTLQGALLLCLALLVQFLHACLCLCHVPVTCSPILLPSF